MDTPNPMKPASSPPPLVSVVIPCYNQAQYLREAVESVAAQSYPQREIVIVDDGSPDDTRAVAQALTAEFPYLPISLVEQANGGLSRARNAGIAQARGRYILPLDADDKIHPEMLAKCVDLLESRPDIAIAYTDYQHFGDVDFVQRTPEYDFTVLSTQKCLHTATALYRKAAWTATGGYKANMVWGMEDWEFWIHCGKLGYFGHRIPEALFYYRAKLAGSMIQVQRAHFEELWARIVLNHPDLYPGEIQGWAGRIWARALAEMLAGGGRYLNYLARLDLVALIGDAECLGTQGDFAHAAALYHLWLEHNPQQELAYAIHFNLGVALAQAGDAAGAERSYLKALELKPDFAAAATNLGLMRARSAQARGDGVPVPAQTFGVDWLAMDLPFPCELHAFFPRTETPAAGAKRVLLIFTEPPSRMASAAWVRQHHHEFDLIVTYQRELADLPNVRLLEFGSCWCGYDDPPAVKDFSVSFILSTGCDDGLEGYALRRAIATGAETGGPPFKLWLSRKGIRLAPEDIPQIQERERLGQYLVQGLGDSKVPVYASMYNLAIENTDADYYFTEKLIDCFINFSVPLYYGTGKIAEIFDMDGIIPVRDIGQVNQALAGLDPADYWRRMPALLRNHAIARRYARPVQKLQALLAAEFGPAGGAP